jgi:hypothetical protein
MVRQIQLLDVVALLDDCQEIGLSRGQVGTIVEVYEPGVFEVEFSNDQGHTYALATLPAHQLLLLHHQTPSQERTLSMKQ